MRMLLEPRQALNEMGITRLIRSAISFDSTMMARYYPGDSQSPGHLMYRHSKVSSRARIANPVARVRTVFSLMVLVLLVTSAVTLHAKVKAHRAPKTVRHKIDSLERKLQAAQLDGNVGVMANMMADDYVGISPEGTLKSKTETLASFKSGALHFTAMDAGDRKIRVYGGTAVVVSKVKVTGTHDGKDVSGTYRYTRVYHFDGTNWKIVSFEASQIPDHAKLASKQD